MCGFRSRVLGREAAHVLGPYLRGFASKMLMKSLSDPSLANRVIQKLFPEKVIRNLTVISLAFWTRSRVLCREDMHVFAEDMRGFRSRVWGREAAHVFSEYMRGFRSRACLRDPWFLPLHTPKRF
jgi:hypothetical protein